MKRINKMNIFQITKNQTIKVYKHGETFETQFVNYREITTKYGTFEIHTTNGIIYTDGNGKSVNYNGHSTWIEG